MKTKYNQIKKLNIEIKKIENLSNAYSKIVAENKDYITLMITITFGNHSNARIKPNMIDRFESKYYELLKKQHQSFMHFIKKLRKTKYIKFAIHYFTAFELQKNKNLHLHMHLSLHIKDLEGFIKFIYWYKKQIFNNIFNIGRTHIGLSTSYKNIIEKELILKEVKDKTDSNRIMYIIDGLEARDFYSGEATFWEFVSISDLKNRYNENILNYIKKTVASQIDLETIKIGTTKNWTSHNIKSIIHSIENSNFRNDIKIIRKVGLVYTYSYSTFALKFKLYQSNYSKLIKMNKRYNSYYRANKDFKRGILSTTKDKKLYYNNIAI